MTFDTQTEPKPSGISKVEIEARRALREHVEGDPELTEIVTNELLSANRLDLLDPVNEKKLKVFKSAVVDAVVSAERPAPTEQGQLETRWKSWFGRPEDKGGSGFSDPEYWVREVKKVRDRYLRRRQVEPEVTGIIRGTHPDLINKQFTAYTNAVIDLIVSDKPDSLEKRLELRLVNAGFSNPKSWIEEVRQDYYRYERGRQVQSEVTGIITNPSTHEELHDELNDDKLLRKFEAYRDAVVYAIVLAEIPVAIKPDTKKTQSGQSDPLESRLEALLRAAGFRNSEYWAKQVIKDRDQYLDENHQHLAFG